MSTLHDRDAGYFRAILDDAASHRELTVVEREIRAVLAETTTTQPEAEPEAEPEADERDRVLLTDALRALLPISTPAGAFHAANVAIAAGFRRSRQREGS